MDIFGLRGDSKRSGRNATAFDGEVEASWAPDVTGFGVFSHVLSMLVLLLPG